MCICFRFTQEVNAYELRSKYENTVEPVIVLTSKECLAVVLQDRMIERSYIRKSLNLKVLTQQAKLRSLFPYAEFPCI